MVLVLWEWAKWKVCVARSIVVVVVWGEVYQRRASGEWAVSAVSGVLTAVLRWMGEGVEHVIVSATVKIFLVMR